MPDLQAQNMSEFLALQCLSATWKKTKAIVLMDASAGIHAIQVLSSMRLITFLELLTSGHTATAALTEGALTSMKQRTLFPYSIMGSMLRLWPEGSLPRPDRLDGLVTETNV